MQISVAICTWNRASLLRQTLEQFRQLHVPAHVTLDLIVVDNNSTDSTKHVVNEFVGALPIRYEFEREPGLSPARNKALDVTRAELLLFTDDDVLVAPNWLAACVAAYEQYPDAGAFGGPIFPWFPVQPDPVLSAAFPMLARGFCGTNYERTLGPLDEELSPIGANMAFRVAAVGDLRFDPRHGPKEAEHRGGGDELDFIERLRQRGHQVIWVPDMVLRHYVDPSRMTLEYLRMNTEGHGAFLVRRNGVGTAPLVLGAPRWAWKRAAAQLVRYYVLRAGRRRRDAFLALHDYFLVSGMIKQSREQARVQANSPVA